MRKMILVLAISLSVACVSVQAGPFDWLKSKISEAQDTKLSSTQVGAGLKEALKTGIEKTIKLLSAKDGYFANEGVKILLPKNVRSIEPTLRRLGLASQIDEFTLSMNRAAEKAAPLASDIFSSAITDISFTDAQKILNGGDTAATEYLKSATYNKLLEAFKPSVSAAMQDYAVTKKYEAIAGKIKSLPFVSKMAGDIDISNYVSTKALDGMFKTLGQQETLIRTDPKARVTELLRKVFAAETTKK